MEETMMTMTCCITNDGRSSFDYSPYSQSLINRPPVRPSPSGETFQSTQSCWWVLSFELELSGLFSSSARLFVSLRLTEGFVCVCVCISLREPQFDQSRSLCLHYILIVVFCSIFIDLKWTALIYLNMVFSYFMQTFLRAARALWSTKLANR